MVFSVWYERQPRDSFTILILTERHGVSCAAREAAPVVSLQFYFLTEKHGVSSSVRETAQGYLYSFNC